MVIDFSCDKELLLKEIICSLYEQILSFKRSSNFEKGAHLKRITARASSLPLMCVNFQRSGYAIALNFSHIRNFTALCRY